MKLLITLFFLIVFVSSIFARSYSAIEEDSLNVKSKKIVKPVSMLTAKPYSHLKGIKIKPVPFNSLANKKIVIHPAFFKPIKKEDFMRIARSFIIRPNERVVIHPAIINYYYQLLTNEKSSRRKILYNPLKNQNKN